MRRLLVISNRLPVSVERRRNEFRFSSSVGGLATGLNALHQRYESVWVGWPGIAINRDENDYVESKLSEFNCYPVFLSQGEVEKYYYGFSNKTLWPLFHYFPQYANYEHAEWSAYEHVNRKFCECVAEIAKPEDVIWIHDYHLMLLPGLIRDSFPDATIGFFLHIPFPSADLFRLIPWSKIIFSMDRLDYTKGIPERLYAFEHFLETHPEWHEKVVFILKIVPSRTKVGQYRVLKQEIDELVGRINGKYGTPEWVPISYFYRSLPFQTIVAFYLAADVALMTSMRDGMNLIAKEFVASRVDGKGVLILSEMAGAARELGEALVVNPNNKEEVAEALNEALRMPEEEQKSRNEEMQKRLSHYDVFHWGSGFIRSVLETKRLQEELNMKKLSEKIREELKNAYKAADKHLLLLDYDGTLVPFADKPERAKPDKELTDQLIDLTACTELQVMKGNKVVEVKDGRVNKRIAASHWLTKGFGFILAVGDDLTDEDMFKVIPEDAYSVKIGFTPSKARFYLGSPKEVRALLDEMEMVEVYK